MRSASFESIWSDGYDGEPLVDMQLLETSNILSIFTRSCNSVGGESNAVVLDFTLPDAIETSLIIHCARARERSLLLCLNIRMKIRQRDAMICSI